MGGGFGSAYYGTLDRVGRPSRAPTSIAFGFSLGSGVHGDGVINAINFAGTRYTFAAPTVRWPSKEECKNGGWVTSTQPVFKNQGDCVSSFASQKSTKAKLSAFAI